MAVHIQKEHQAQVDKIVTYAKNHFSENESALISQFIPMYFAHVSLEDLQEHRISDLYGAALSHWELMYRRRPGELKIITINPHYEQHGWQSTHTILQVITDDMPFLIDSIRMELNRMGITSHLMIFTGGVKVKRDHSGRIIEVLSYDSDDADAMTESPIYLEIDRQNDPQVINNIQSNLKRVINDVRSAVEDWEAMKKRLREIVFELQRGPMTQKQSEVDEAIAFLEWLLNDHFTFLGARDYEVVGRDENLALRLVPGSGLGVLRDDTHSKVYRQLADLPAQARELMLSNEQILIISKTNTRSTVHRPTYTDYIGIKRFNQKGELIGERRFIGLYTSTAYIGNPREIPFLRRKVASILKKSGLPERSHSGKDLHHILANLPRDDLFQATLRELYQISMGILHLQERRKIRLFTRKDAYGRFMSCLVYLPRENFSSELIKRIQAILMKALQGVEASFTTQFSESVLARIHYIVRIDPKKEISFNHAEVENQLVNVGRSWHDGLRESVLEYFGEESGARLVDKYLFAFPVGYRDSFAPRNAVYDIENIEKLSTDRLLHMSFYRPLGAARDVIKFKLFCANDTVPLSDTLPMLENMGLRVIGEVPYEIVQKGGAKVWINDFSMTYAIEPTFEVEEVKNIFQESFYRVWLGDAENDSFNRLVLEAQLNWREIAVLRAYSRYLRQIGFPFSFQYIAETLINNAAISKLLVELFKYRFDPEKDKDVEFRKSKCKQLKKAIQQKLDDVAILDEDRILRRYLEVIFATLRTNFFQSQQNAEPKEYISFKFDPQKIPDLPLPLPVYEIFVYSPRFEGIHLRAGKVARGGIRWSDRREDFRTEVLGLMKAQQVKNSLIVPAGAKGGFVAKNLPVDGTREAILEEGITCYRGFIHGLLDLTDNLVENAVVPPKNTICYDDDDPYLVVAADKGTATFSDIANSIAIEQNYWLGDAFASGGSTGYDHKKMGITARGAWVSAERHFQDLGINVDNTEITVVGIGDMSGDVFGNGLLMSPYIKLVCAFNHQHIFIDPNPDPEKSYQERTRLFDMPRSTWDDYNRELISQGGGVYPRSAKAIRLTSEVKKLLGIKSHDVIVPSELIRMILKSKVDLIWNGGVGTFIKASTETHDQVGDRTNDALRVDAVDLKARVICEGGNLGVTQLARVEFEQKGGKVNTDFIDNSAGVDCSDHEVNIKILLNLIVESGDLTEKQRNQLLSRMTDEVSDLVLQNNYHQNLAISLASYLAPSYVELHSRYINALDEENKINRELEYLPSQKELLDRKSEGKGLTRPELSVLMAYTKILLDTHIRQSTLTKDPYFNSFIKNAFPTPLRRRYGEQMSQHRLANEIISTQLSNQLVSDMGITFMYQMSDETGATINEIIRAYIAAREVFHMPELFVEIEALDYKIDATVQLKIYEEVIRLVRRVTRWLLRTRRHEINIEQTIEQFSNPVAGLSRRLPRLLLGAVKENFEQYRDELIAANVPADTALKIAGVSPMFHSLNIIEAATTYDSDVYQVAKIYFALVDSLDLVWFREQLNTYPEDNRWSVLAKASYKGDLDWVQRELTNAIMQCSEKKKQVSARVQSWMEKHKDVIERWNAITTSIRNTETKDFALISVALRELMELAQHNSHED